MIPVLYLSWVIALTLPSGETHYFETSPELCIAAESSPGHLEMPDGSIAIPEIAVCWPPDPCVCEPETEAAGS